MRNLLIVGLFSIVLMVGCSKEYMEALKADMSNPKINSAINKSGLSKEAIAKAKNSVAMELYGVSFDKMQKMAMDKTITTAALSTVSPAAALGFSAGNQSTTSALSIAMNKVNRAVLEKIEKGELK